MSISVSTALCLSSQEINTLVQGRSIAATPQSYIYPEQSFALCSAETQSASGTVTIRAWAKCELCQPLSDSDASTTLSRLTAKSVEEFQKLFQERQYIFLTYLRVYLLHRPVEVSAKFQGHLAAFSEPLIVNTSSPVLSDQSFVQRKRQLENLEPPLHPELEELYGAIAQLPPTLASKALEKDIATFLGWTGSQARRIEDDLDIAWIKRITQVGNSSDGYEFEKLIRKSLIKIGFSNSLNNPKASLNPESTGGSGGIDVYCNVPYSLIGECKASQNQTVPTDVCSQLTYLGQTWLEQGQYDQSVKVIFAAGKLAKPANNVAIGNKMNVLRPATIQKLVDLKVKYSGCINLLSLKTCLEASPFGEDADIKLNEYIEKVKQEFKVRSHLIRAVKQLNETEPNRTQFEVTEIRAQYNVAFGRTDNYILDNQTAYEFLIELASPLTGYLGRIKASGITSDRFYYLRDL